MIAAREASGIEADFATKFTICAQRPIRDARIILRSRGTDGARLMIAEVGRRK